VKVQQIKQRKQITVPVMETQKQEQKKTLGKKSSLKCKFSI